MVILGTAKCDQTSMGTDVMCKSSQLVYNYLLICLTLSYVLSGGMAFHRRKHGIEFVCPEKKGFPRRKCRIEFVCPVGRVLRRTNKKS